MKTVLLFTLSVLACGIAAHAQKTQPALAPVSSLILTEDKHPHQIDIQVTVDKLPYEEYWTKTFDSIFTFADSNSDGSLSAEEIHLVPSARAVRLSLGNAFTPPVASIQSLEEIVSDESTKCSKEQLRQYYLRHGAGRLQIGTGRLPHTAAMTAALVQALDANQDNKLSQAELKRAETTLRRLDTNDDELIGAGELVPNATYPGSWAANTLQTGKAIDLSPTGDHSLTLKEILTTHPDEEIKHVPWLITISDQVSDRPLHVATSALCQSWSVPGPLNELHAHLREEIANAVAESQTKTTKSKRSRDRRPSRAWLTPLADRDRNGTLSQQEIDQWLQLQQQLIHGQLLISIYYQGGLFELLDTNHDAGLSVRELREMWQTLESASCTVDNHVDPTRVPNVVLFVVSQGYPETLARTSTSEIEWFRLMDRNHDGDVSSREFTGAPNAFDRLDQNHDGLISPHEAAQSK